MKGERATDQKNKLGARFARKPLCDVVVVVVVVVIAVVN